MHDARTIFYNDMDDEQAEDAAKHVCPISRNLLETPMASYVSWMDPISAPMTYIICERNNAIPPAMSERLISSLEVPCEVVRLDAGHSPFLNMPEDLAATVRRAAGEACRHGIE